MIKNSTCSWTSASSMSRKSWLSSASFIATYDAPWRFVPAVLRHGLAGYRPRILRHSPDHRDALGARRRGREVLIGLHSQRSRPSRPIRPGFGPSLACSVLIHTRSVASRLSRGAGGVEKTPSAAVSWAGATWPLDGGDAIVPRAQMRMLDGDLDAAASPR